MTSFFSSEARRQFDPISEQHGLVCTSSTEGCVRYESNKVSLLINYDCTRSYELGVEIGRRGANYSSPAFSLAEILRLRGVQDAVLVSRLMVSEEGKLSDALSKLARLTASHASDFLEGNQFSFAQIEGFRKKEGAEFELASQLRFARSAAELAWPEKDFAAIVKILEPVEAYLSLSERKKLEYSRKHLSGSESGNKS